MSSAKAASMEPELRTMLGRHREELLRRALTLAVSRASLDELAERPLAARLDELELVFEAAAAGGEQPRGARNRDLQSELDHQLDEHRLHGRTFSVAVIAAGRARVARLGKDVDADRRPPGPDGRAWTNALRECASPSDVVIDAGDGASAVVFPEHDAREARIAAQRLCRAAWRTLGEQGPLAGAGVATYPEDGSSGTEIVAAAYDALWRQADFEDAPPPAQTAEEPPPDDRPPAPVHPLRPL